MAAERKCPECTVRESANRNGKPGRCVVCIDKRYRHTGWDPREPYVSPKHMRLCVCLECERPDEVSYAEIRNRDSRYCYWCVSRQMYERGLAAQPSRWDITLEQAAQIVIGDNFLARGADGETLAAPDLARQMEDVWSLVDVECAVCATISRWSASWSLSNPEAAGRSRCMYCYSRPMGPWQNDFFRQHGLVREHDGYARLGQRVAAHCEVCGHKRSISISELKSGVAPCLNCAETADPDAIHIVYLMHFPALRAYKVGFTSTEVRHDRIASHAAHGGMLIEQHEVPNMEAARTVEDVVLRAVRGFPSGCTERDFPQGGYTETWSDDAPAIDLGDVVSQLARDEAPGFDRLSKFRAYFEDEPPTIEELLPFRRIETEEVDGTTFHHVGFSEPLEQVYRKIQARREALPADHGELA
ncbi:hypothetical protein GCM10009654_29730 [Streptomyces hebeiensis]|uniref:GIY-YIG nuclease family protein n=1 Tax=Streptomyces hebeiensis TaxID=229486 RepID=A0ABN1UUH4_9ACTN